MAFNDACAVVGRSFDDHLFSLELVFCHFLNMQD